MHTSEVGSKAQAVCILVIEDDAAVRAQIAGALTERGHRVVLANGLALIGVSAPDSM